MAGALALSMVFSGCGNQTKENDSQKMVEATSEFDSNFTLTREIEQVEIENGEVGYKVPRGYIPYEVDDSYRFPGMAGVYEMTDKYVIYELPKVITAEGEEFDTSYDGAIAVCEPCFALLHKKNDILNKYGKLPEKNTLTDYSFATPEEQEILYQIDLLESVVRQEYEKSKGISLSK